MITKQVKRGLTIHPPTTQCDSEILAHIIRPIEADCSGMIFENDEVATAEARKILLEEIENYDYAWCIFHIIKELTHLDRNYIASLTAARKQIELTLALIELARKGVDSFDATCGSYREGGEE